MPVWDVSFDLHIDLTSFRLVSGVVKADALAAILREYAGQNIARRDLEAELSAQTKGRRHEVRDAVDLAPARGWLWRFPGRPGGFVRLLVPEKDE